MGLIVGQDDGGRYVVLGCDGSGCDGHVSLRPIAPDCTPRELAAACFEIALDEGWRFAGVGLCPRHAPDALERPLRLADGYDWLAVAPGTLEGV